MKIGVSGASGKLGSATIAALQGLASGHGIVGISRTPEALPSTVEARFGDYDQPDSLASAYAGLDRLLIIPTTDMRPGQRTIQHLAAVDAAVAAGVGHVSLMSSAGTRRAKEPDIWGCYFPAEQRLMRTAGAWSILRMNFYAEAFVQEVRSALDRGAIAGIGDGRVGYVSRDDLARAAAGLLTGDGHDGAIYTGTGPESLSGTERAAIAGAVAGRSLRYVELTEEAFRSTMAQAGLPPPIVAVVVSIRTRFAMGGFDIVTGDIERLSGRRPRSLRDVLSDAFSETDKNSE
ncbi:NAD(P)H dehydrogenase (quinone) [Azospirillum oryzae]|uniref:NAD(P)H dehydrogenase (Quinone) n=1 Tax=Azospirillum oryzae TaxID=286727 RepID=A0A1X7ELB8_9PROT|nr:MULTISPECIES: NAD(P)H-binding protein [Azospirillum]QCG95846.1 SDR family NAD(P)-dependent oxidoreductase [Azospirillum sp. TSA2s]SMF35918.1 NAD(P)H dehydrogenase (quinone) [Azospirillum oryzae]